MSAGPGLRLLDFKFSDSTARNTGKTTLKYFTDILLSSSSWQGVF